METNLYPQPSHEDWVEQLPTSVGVERYFAGLSADDLWRNFFLGVFGFTFLYVIINFFISWYRIGQPFAGFLHHNRVVTESNLPGQVAIPFFIAFIILVTIGPIAYLHAARLEVRLFALFSLALIYFFASFSSFITGKLVIFHFSVAFIGKIVMPILLLHFLLLFPHPRKALKEWPFLIPLIYLPILPALVHIPILFVQPETTRNFNSIINAYTVIYGVIGLILLGNVIIQTKDSQVRKQAIVLSLGLAALPTLLLLSLFWTYTAIDRDLIFNVLERYGLVAVPISVAIAVIRYEMFGIQRTFRSHFLYVRATIIALIACLFLLVLIFPRLINVSQFNLQDPLIILSTVAGFYMLRFVYRRSYQWWLDHHFYSTIEELRVNLRLFLRTLLKVKFRRDLERLVSWNIPPDFGVQHAEVVPGNMPTRSYALQLPLGISKISMGTLFLGPKISGGKFTNQELAIFSELQRQISLVLLSLELDDAIQTTEQLTRLKSKFLTNVTHELRAPLNGIINYIGFVVDDYIDSLNQEQRVHLESALHGAETLEQIINNILDMSKIEAGQMTLNIQPTNLAEIVDRTTPIVEEIIGDKPVKLITEVKPDLPNLYGDRLRLRQIILNMLSNAAKFTQEGSIHLSARPDNGNIIVQVKDTGIGIDGELLPTIFQHFTSTGLTDANQHTGPGLSMPITKSLVELHGGRLDVESNSDQGTTFTITLPIKQEE